MSLLFVTHEDCLEHLTGPGHPERPARLAAVADGIERAGLADALQMVAAPAVELDAVRRVHESQVVEVVERLAAKGGGHIDGDTSASPASYDAARLAAGAGLEAVARLEAGEAGTAFCAIRPPGHHATIDRSMGFCLFNNVAVTARYLADRGERVVIVDYDAHHGNGTQDIFYEDANVLFVSFHQWPCYPGTGWYGERGTGEGAGTTINLPLPPGATGDVYAAAWDRIVLPQLEAFGPTWLLISAGFDAHRADPITDMGLSAGDFAALTRRVIATVPPGHRVVFLEGGYDLDALTESSAAVLSTLIDLPYETEAETNAGPGVEMVQRIANSLAEPA